MNDDRPLEAALEKIPKNELRLEGSASQADGAAVQGSYERERGRSSYGVEGGISQRKGWGVAGFWRRTFGRK